MIRRVLQWLFPLFFSFEPTPKLTNPDLVAAVSQLKQCHTVEEAAQLALSILAKKYRSRRLETYLLFFKWFEKDPNMLWQRSGFMHCTQQNYLFKVLMVSSGWITDDAISLGYSLVWWISPHEYLKLKLPTGFVAVDPWNYNFGVGYGWYATGFGSRQLDTNTQPS